MCPFVGLHCGCVPPPCENMCVRSLGYIVGASPPRVCPFVGSLHAVYSALGHFFSIIYVSYRTIIAIIKILIRQKLIGTPNNLWLFPFQGPISYFGHFLFLASAASQTVCYCRWSGIAPDTHRVVFWNIWSTWIIEQLLHSDLGSRHWSFFLMVQLWGVLHFGVIFIFWAVLDFEFSLHFS